MRQLLIGLLLTAWSGCLGCMKDFVPVETYKGGTVIKVRKYLWGGSITIDDKTNNQWALKGLKINPDTKEVTLETAERASDASGPMKAFEGQQLNILAGMQLALQQSEIQRQTWKDTLEAGKEMFATAAAAVPVIMAARPPRSSSGGTSGLSIEALLPIITGNPDLAALVGGLTQPPPNPHEEPNPGGGQ
jgi:hypothetical protein